jgi:hypothetical protein
MIDNAIEASSEDVDEITQRCFYNTLATYQFDWPNFQYAPPWKLYLDKYEMAAYPTLVVTGNLLPVPVVIPEGTYFMRPVNSGPPYTSLELRRDLNSAFGSNSTPQLDIAITGLFGYWTRTRAAGSFAANVLTTDNTVQISNSSLVGVGDVILAGSESMIVNDSSFIPIGITFSSGITTASAADNAGSVSNGSLLSVGEVILVDYEWMLVQNIIGNEVVVKRAYSGSVLTSHSGGQIYAARQLSVLRGQLGTTAAPYSSGLSLTVSDVPGKVRELAIAEAVVTLTAQPGGYSQAVAGLGGSVGQGATMGTTGAGQQREPVPGAGLPDLRSQMMNSRYARKARSRVI